jgi:hypothetical protein
MPFILIAVCTSVSVYRFPSREMYIRILRMCRSSVFGRVLKLDGKRCCLMASASTAHADLLGPPQCTSLLLFQQVTSCSRRYVFYGSRDGNPVRRWCFCCCLQKSNPGTQWQQSEPLAQFGGQWKFPTSPGLTTRRSTLHRRAHQGLHEYHLREFPLWRAIGNRCLSSLTAHL